VAIHDISVPIRADMPIYEGNPGVELERASSIADGDPANVSRLSFGVHTGTHVDAPRHMIDGAAGVERLALEVLMGPAVVVSFGDDVMAVGESALRAFELDGQMRVLLKTRNSRFIREGTFHKDYTYLAPDGAEYLAKIGVKLVGVDYLSIEQFHSGHHKTHRTLLERGIVIVEGLDFSGVDAGDYTLCCLPLRLEGLDGAPARAVLMKD